MKTEEINIQTQNILNDFYKNVSEKNANSIISLLSEDIDWYIIKSERLPWTGKQTEKSAINKVLQLLFDAHVDGEDELKPDHIFIDGYEAAVFGSMSRKVKMTGKRFTTTFCQRFTIKDGKITKFLMLEDTPEIEKAF